MSLLLAPDTPRKRMAVLGLDGLPLSLAAELGKSLPNIRRLAQRATSVRAELPELSPVNWTSFYTAEGPEKHGVFGFSRLDPETYKTSVADSSHVRCPTVFDRLGEAGLVSRVVNLPNTYPARPLRGMLVAGFVAHDLEHAVHPPFLAAELAKAGYKLEADTSRKNRDPDFLLAELRRTLASRLHGLDMLWADLSWDLFVHVFTETDRLFHFFMDAVKDFTHPHHLECLRFLADWDEAIGVFLDKYDALPEPKRLMVLADHGFTELKTEVCVNTWLKHQGLLTLSGPPANGWDATVIGPSAKAFALDPGRIYVHAKDRFARGRVTGKEKPGLVEAIRSGLMRLTWQGERVMEHIYTADELYPGAPEDQRPDLVCEPRPGFDLKAKFDRQDVFGLHGRTGTHTADGAIFLDTGGSRPQRMRDTGRVLLKYFNL